MYNPALDVGDAAGLFRAHHLQHEGEDGETTERVEVQSPKRPKKKSGKSSYANVCAVEAVGDDDGSSSNGIATRRSARLKTN